MEYNVNDIINVTISSITPYGAFVTTDSEYTGLIHISEITGKYIKDINKYFKVGDVLTVKITKVNAETKQLCLSTKGFIEDKSRKDNSLQEDEKGFKNLKNSLEKWIKNTIKDIEKR